ncbi:hypothetical protein I6G79_00130 [Burkholderia plantarii]|nr:hypothetical protein [Burkholderia plantarii]
MLFPCAGTEKFSCKIRDAVRGVWVFFLIFACCPELAVSQSGDSIIYGYRNCTWQDNRGTITASVDIDFTDLTMWKNYLKSRAIEMWWYDSNGNPHVLGFSSSPVNVMMNGSGATEKYPNIARDMENMAFGGVGGAWVNERAFTAHVTATFPGDDKREVSILAGNIGWAGDHTNYTFAATTAGAAYLRPGMQGAVCPVAPPYNPPQPPKPPITLITIAPDWNLGELPLQHGEKKFTVMSDQLCFYYSDPTAVTLNLVLDADSQNGVVGGQYQLKDLDDPTQVVPYSLVLNDGSDEVVLPNLGKSGIRLNPLNPTCFAPTFRTFVAPYLKPGYYSDVLTFTIVTKT